MKNLKQTLNLLSIAIIILSLSSCSGGLGGGIKQLQPEVNGPFNEYFQIIDNAPKIERVQDGDWVNYDFNILIKIKKPFVCTDCIDTTNNPAFDGDAVKIILKFYGEDKKPLAINGQQEISFDNWANTCVGKDLCKILSKPKDSEVWFNFQSHGLKKESKYFDKYPSEEIKYFTVETGD